MRLLGLDVGDRRIGVAASDGVIARPLTVIERRSRVEDFATIGELVRQRQAEILIVGLPTSSEGEAGAQARRIRRYARELARAVAIPLTFIDESYSTIDATEIMRAGGQSRKKRRERVDAVAAAVILQAYIDAEAGQSDLLPRSVIDPNSSDEGSA